MDENCLECKKRAKVYGGAGILLGAAIGVGVFVLIGKLRA